MRRTALTALCLSLLSATATAQPEVFFGPGEPPEFREADMDRRFLRSRVNQALNQGTSDANCAQLVGALLTMLGETAPMLHKRDENFYVDPMLLQALGSQLSTPRFPANLYFVSMVRRVLIDKKLPDEWMKTAEALAPYYPAMDLDKLRFIATGVKPVDSFLFTLPALRDRYEVEVTRANATVSGTAEALFRDNYLDHEVAFGGLEFVDAKLEKPKKKRLKKGEEPEAPALVAHLLWYLPVPPEQRSMIVLDYGKPKKRPSVTITARLLDSQFLDLSRVPKGSRLLARGRLWEFKKAVTDVELRDALLFLDRDWSQGANLADPNAVAACPLAFNDLTGLAPVQPGGFGSRR
ncbi:hypothetical protein JGU66_26525 [Myxococcaceae bacterium JPH2]|nr:hypothetical protein [Myxococcaceae bacterium JPH2]